MYVCSCITCLKVNFMQQCYRVQLYEDFPGRRKVVDNYHYFFSQHVIFSHCLFQFYMSFQFFDVSCFSFFSISNVAFTNLSNESCIISCCIKSYHVSVANLV